MIKKIFKTAALLMAMIALTSCGTKETSAPSASNEVNEAEAETTEAFDIIEISVASGDINLKRGDSFSLSYHLHDKEIVKEKGVTDGKLTLKTNIDFKFKPDYGSFYVDITIPEDADLEDLDLSSVAGNINIEGVKFKEADLHSVSGSIKGNKTEGSELDSDTTSGNIDFKESSISEIEAETISGIVDLEGSFKEVEAKTVSGNISLSGNVENSAEMETVSGKIKTDAPFSTISAETVGKIKYMGNEQGRKFKIEAGAPSLSAKSVSGAIEIN